MRKIAFFFDRSRSLRLRRFTAENLCPSAPVVRVHDDAMIEKYAVLSTTVVLVEDCWSHLRTYGPVDINNVGCSGSLLITRTAHFSVCMNVSRSIACSLCDSWAHTSTMRVQNYTGSGIKRDSHWMCCSGWFAIWFVCVVCRERREWVAGARVPSASVFRDS